MKRRVGYRIFLSGLVLWSCPVWASLKGFYGGLEIGVISLISKGTLIQSVGPPVPLVLSFQTQSGANKLSYGFFLGYMRTVWQTVCLGGDFYVDFAQPTVSRQITVPTNMVTPGTSNVFGEALRKKPLIGLAARIGITTSLKIVPYFKIGAEFSGFVYQALRGGAHTGDRIKNSTGLALGLGVDFPVTDSFFVRADWALTFYSTIKIPNLTFATGETRTFIKTLPQTQAFRIGAGYSF